MPGFAAHAPGFGFRVFATGGAGEFLPVRSGWLFSVNRYVPSK
jgi:hypothetical protein